MSRLVALLAAVLLVAGVAPVAAGATTRGAGATPCWATSTVDVAEGGQLDIDRYGGAHLCATNELVFTFQTHDDFTNADVSEVYVRIDTDGDVTNGCGEGDYLAYARPVAPDNEIQAGVFSSASCDALESLAVATVDRPSANTLTVTFSRSVIGDAAVMGHYGSLANPGENNTTADYAPDTDRVVLDTTPLPDPVSAPVCVSDPTDDVVVRDGDGNEQPATLPAADLTRACVRYGDGVGMDVVLPELDFAVLGAGSGPAALIDTDGDLAADRVLRAIWDGIGFTTEVTDADGTVTCRGRTRLAGTTLQTGDLSPDCFGSPVNLDVGIGMGAVASADSAYVDRAGEAAFARIPRAAPLDPNNTGAPPTAITVADPADRPQTNGLTRLAGPARVETSVAVSQDAWPDGASAAVLARQDVEADALAGAALAAAINAPLLLTASNALSEATAIELRRLLPAGARVYALGGAAALQDRVLADVQQLGYGVTRLAGATRVETGLAIAKEAAAHLPEVEHVLVADAFTFQSALVAGAAAGGNNGVVLTTSATGLSDAGQAFIDDHPDATVTAVGGAASSAVPSARSLNGATDYETAVLVAAEFYPAATRAAVASGESFPDGLGGGAFAGSLGMPLLLSPRDELSTAASNHLSGGSWNEIYLFGGTAALTASVEDALRGFVS